MNFTRAMLPKGDSVGFNIPIAVQEKHGIRPGKNIYFVQTRTGVRGSFYPVPGSERRKITKGPKRPQGGTYLSVVVPKGWIASRFVSVFWNSRDILIKEVDE